MLQPKFQQRISTTTTTSTDPRDFARSPCGRSVAGCLPVVKCCHSLRRRPRAKQKPDGSKQGAWEPLKGGSENGSQMWGPMLVLGDRMVDAIFLHPCLDLAFLVMLRALDAKISIRPLWEFVGYDT